MAILHSISQALAAPQKESCQWNAKHEPGVENYVYSDPLTFHSLINQEMLQHLEII